MKPISTSEFISASLLNSAIILILLLPWSSLSPLALAGVCFAKAAVLSHFEQRKSVRKNAVIIGIACGVAVLLLVFVAPHYVPDDTSAAVLAVLTHPALLLPVWLVSLLNLYRGWRLGRRAGTPRPQA